MPFLISAYLRDVGWPYLSVSWVSGQLTACSLVIWSPHRSLHVLCLWKCLVFPGGRFGFSRGVSGSRASNKGTRHSVRHIKWRLKLASLESEVEYRGQKYFYSKMLPSAHFFMGLVSTVILIKRAILFKLIIKEQCAYMFNFHSLKCTCVISRSLLGPSWESVTLLLFGRSNAYG